MDEAAPPGAPTEIPRVPAVAPDASRQRAAGRVERQLPGEAPDGRRTLEVVPVERRIPAGVLDVHRLRPVRPDALPGC
ncbi:MAG TPA: hypothetical protein VF190_13305, partial [Rhodothermales bacterium]